MHSRFNNSLFRSILFVVLMENWHGIIVSSNKKIHMPWFDLCCSVSTIKNSMQQDLTLIGHHLPGERNGNVLQYSCLENPIDRGAWWAIVHRVAKSDIAKWLHSCSFFFFRFFFSSFLDKDYFQSLCRICYNIASVLCFGFLARRPVGSYLPDQGSIPHPLYWKKS